MADPYGEMCSQRAKILNFEDGINKEKQLINSVNYLY